MAALQALDQFLIVHFFVTRESERDCRYRLYPDMISDLKSDHLTHEKRQSIEQQYEDFQEELIELCVNVRKAYQQYRKEVKITLFL